ncbi:MAG: ComEA family DNA-binding protein [Bacteroidota bacterium]
MKFPVITDRTKLGMTLWACCILVIIMTPRIMRYLVPSEPIEIQRYQMKAIERLEKNAYRQKQKRYQKHRHSTYHSPPQRFNPNRYSLEEWMYLGLSQKQAAAVMKFCRFPLKSNADLKKIFIIPDALYQLIEDSTFYEPTLFFEGKPKEVFKKKETQIEPILMVDLDSSRLVALPGIGPFYAKMVMKYEKALGGFHSKEQLLEVYKMNEEVYEILCKHLNFNQPNIRKISINQATKEELAKHPYIDTWQANSIIKMRKQLSGFQSLKELLDSHLINPESFEKMLPYVSL